MKAANIICIIVFVFLIVGIATAVTYRKQFDVDVLGDWLAGAGVMAPLLFIGIYAISTGRNAVAGGEGMIKKALLGLGLLTLVAFLPRLIKRLRRC